MTDIRFGSKIEPKSTAGVQETAGGYGPGGRGAAGSNRSEAHLRQRRPHLRDPLVAAAAPEKGGRRLARGRQHRRPLPQLRNRLNILFFCFKRDLSKNSSSLFSLL